MNDDLISKRLAVEAIESIRGCIWDVDIPSPTVPEYVEHHEQMQGLMRKCDAWLSIIEREPSAQPLIRCQDCKHHHHEKDIPYCDRIDYGYGWKDDDFCSRAERREE